MKDSEPRKAVTTSNTSAETGTNLSDPFLVLQKVNPPFLQFRNVKDSDSDHLAPVASETKAT
ncbi:hypothetical protein MKFW12EY_17620 [Methylomonas koyamae]|nr:hypothetical protein MKFW12EY_17620 [Methylomonas koyamae]